MEPGPFVMPPNLAAQFLMKANFQTPRLGRVINTACFLISSHKWGAGLADVLAALLTWLAALLHTLGGQFPNCCRRHEINVYTEPGNDPEITQNGIEFLLRLLPKYSQVLLNHQPSSSLEFLFMFMLKALAGTEPLPKQAAAEFWVGFLCTP